MRLGRYKSPGDLRIKILENAMINIGLVRLPFWKLTKVGYGTVK